MWRGGAFGLARVGQRARQHAAPSKSAQRYLGGLNLVRKRIKMYVFQANKLIKTADEEHAGGSKLQAIGLKAIELVFGHSR